MVTHSTPLGAPPVPIQPGTGVGVAVKCGGGTAAAVGRTNGPALCLRPLKPARDSGPRLR